MTDKNLSNPTAGTALSNRLNRIKKRKLTNQLSDTPTVRSNKAAAFDPFPLNDMQQAYWLGRDSYFESGDVPMHYYIELQGPDIIISKLEFAWNKLIDRHPSLRAIILKDGRQQILREVPHYDIEIEDLREISETDRQIILAEKRDRLSHHNPDLSHWPQHIIACSLLPDNVTRIHISVDLWCVDGRSLQILFEELGHFYKDGSHNAPDLTLTFRDYVIFQQEFEKSPIWQKAFAYWTDRLETLPPPPTLPMKRDTQYPSVADVSEKAPIFKRQYGLLTHQESEFLRETARTHGVSLASVMMTIYAETLGLFASNKHFSLNIPHFNRPNVHPDINRVIGEFASFTLLEVDLRTPKPFLERVKTIQQRLWQDLDHAQISGVRILRELAKKRPNSNAAAMPVVFTTAPERVIDGKRSELEEMLAEFGESIFNLSQTPQVWIDCQYFELDDKIHYNWDAIEGLFAPEMLSAMFQVFADSLHRLAQESAVWQQQTLFQIPASQLSVRQQINQNNISYSYIDPWHQFKKIVQRYPEKSAIRIGTSHLTYARMYHKTLGLADILAQNGINQESKVALFLPKSQEQAVAVMAIMALGASYVPLDINWPEKRLNNVLNDCQADAVLFLTETPLPNADHQNSLAIDLINLPDVTNDQCPGGKDPESCAYMIYTSGSTGLPKGVILTRKNLSNLLNYSNERFEIGPDDVIYGVTGLHHDLSVYDLFGAFSTGACLSLPTRGSEKDPFQWLSDIYRDKCSFWNSVPASMEMLLAASSSHADKFPASLTKIVLGGDWVPVDLPAKLLAANPDVNLTTIGGPTETTVWNIMYSANHITPDADTIPYGTPIANCGYHILDADLRHCPDGVIGEMYCFGDCVAAGYWNRPEETAKAFITHPATGQRLYATGDMGYYQADGVIRFAGRADSQINLNGYRISPLELENILSDHPQIHKAIILLKDTPELHLAAFLQKQASETIIDLDNIIAYATENLPGQLRLGAVEILDQFPLSDNGKVDRKALATLDIEFLAKKRASEAAATKLEQSLLDMWGQLLGETPQNVLAPFWEMGGNSLHAAQIIAMIKKKLSIDIDFGLFFTNPTVRDLASLIVQNLQRQHPVTPTQPSTPLSERGRV